MTTRRPRPLRGAIVGFGNVAVEGHLPAWRQHRQFTIVAVCDADEARLAMAAELLPTAKRYTSVEALLANERLDFVDVATPPSSHTAIVLAALAKRVHVLCEKPLTTHWDECKQIRSAGSAARAVVFTTHNWKYAPIFRTAKRALRRGDIGVVSHLRLETIRTTPRAMRAMAARGASTQRDRAAASSSITAGTRSIWPVTSPTPSRSRSRP